MIEAYWNVPMWLAVDFIPYQVFAALIDSVNAHKIVQANAWSVYENSFTTHAMCC